MIILLVSVCYLEDYLRLTPSGTYLPITQKTMASKNNSLKWKEEYHASLPVLVRR